MHPFPKSWAPGKGHRLLWSQQLPLGSRLGWPEACTWLSFLNLMKWERSMQPGTAGLGPRPLRKGRPAPAWDSALLLLPTMALRSHLPGKYPRSPPHLAKLPLDWPGALSYPIRKLGSLPPYDTSRLLSQEPPHPPESSKWVKHNLKESCILSQRAHETESNEKRQL